MTQPDPGAPSGTPDPNAPSGVPVGDGTTPPVTAPSGTTETAPTAEETVAKADYDKLLNQLRGNDRQRQQLQSELQAIRDKDLPEMDRLKRDAEAVSQENQRLQGQLKEQAIELAFLRDNKVRWKDSAAALKLLDRSKVTVGDDGTVEGVKIAAEALAKQYPFMVDDAKPEGPAGGTAAAPPASAPPMNGKPNTDNGSSGALLKRLPALGSRRRPGS